MNRNSTDRQKTAGIIRYSCGILFVLFSFCYLFFLQGELLAEAQFVFSKGVTTYNLFIGAVIITLVLQILQWVVSMLSRLPASWHALSYLPPMLMLAILTDVDRATIQHFSFGPWTWIAPVVLVCYCLLVVLSRKVSSGGDDDSADYRAQLYPNYIILFQLILAVGAIPQSTDVYHYELKAERLLLAKDYEAASRVGEHSLRTSARLTQLRMYALSKQGLLAERLFDYPQYDGSRGLLNVADTLSDERFTARGICLHLGAFCGTSVPSTDSYYQLMLADTIWNQHTADYYLCSLLLDKRLQTFCRQLPTYYALSDSVQHTGDHLPRAYREALLLAGDHEAALQGWVVVGGDTLTHFADPDLTTRFNAYSQLQQDLPDQRERINQSHRQFGHTYWWYHDYSDLATGELAPQCGK